MKKKQNTILVIVIGAISIFGLTLLQAQNVSSDLNESLERASINKVLVQYTTGLDTLNPDLYVDVFSDDARFIIGDTVNKGHIDIRKIITDLQVDRKERATQAKTDGKEYQEPLMHHVMSNAVIDFTSETRATHHAYWMTVIGNERDFNVASMGRYEDVLNKIEGEWKISERYLLR